jgi:predicted RecB family nuclease
MRAFGDDGHVSLLPGITPAGGGNAESAAALYAVGIDDIAGLARRNQQDDIDGIRNTAKIVYQARATLSGTVNRAPDVDYVDMPRADIEIDFDLENSGGGWTTAIDPVTGEVTDVRQDPLLYMFSIRTTRRRKLKSGRYRSHLKEITFDTYTDSPEGELMVYLDTWRYFMTMLAKARRGHRSIRFYHYTKHEWTWLRALSVKYAGLPGVPTLEQVNAFLESGLVVDMYEILARQLVWPTMSHSIKSLAKHIGYSWNVQGQVGGDQSISWHQTACYHAEESVRTAAVVKLRAYGQSDVEAQTVLRDWVSEHGDDHRPGSTLASVTSLPVPAFPEVSSSLSA